MPYPSIGMIMLVRDEVDLIADNIRFHADRGFDQFVIMDNASDDGTREALQQLSASFPLKIIDQPKKDFQQVAWATQLARHLVSMRIDWGIRLDADEFVSASEGLSIKQVLAQRDAPTIARRENVLPLISDLSKKGYDAVADGQYRVQKPLGFFGFETDEPAQFPIMLRTLPGKVFFPLRGLRSVGVGGHKVEHKNTERHTPPELLIRHYPVRPFDRFLQRLDHWAERFNQEKTPDPAISHHIRRWLKLRETGRIEKEYEMFALSEDNLPSYLSVGIIAEDHFGKTLRPPRRQSVNA